MLMAMLMGATFTLLMFLCSFVGMVYFVAKCLFMVAFPCAAMAILFGTMIAFGDWRRVWRPLLIRE